MTYDEALRLLDLNNGFSEEDLKKNYKRKMREWHPDICNKPNAEAMAKKINEAKEILSSQKKSTGYVKYDYYYYSENLEMLKAKKMEYINKIEDIFVGVDNIGIDGEASNFAMFKVLFQREYAISELAHCRRIDDLDNIYSYYYNKIYSFFRIYIEYFCSETGMDLSFIDPFNCIVDGKYNINLNRNIYNVYCDLALAKSKRNIFRKVFHKVAEYIS